MICEIQFCALRGDSKARGWKWRKSPPIPTRQLAVGNGANVAATSNLGMVAVPNCHPRGWEWRKQGASRYFQLESSPLGIAQKLPPFPNRQLADRNGANVAAISNSKARGQGETIILYEQTSSSNLEPTPDSDEDSDKEKR